MRSVQFKNRSIKMAGNLYLPNGFKESEQHAAIASSVSIRAVA